MKTATSNRSYYPALDGLRGLAIILVICCHNFNFIPYFSFGWVGVDLFFVLSGFLITDILLNTRESKHFLQHFYVRRMLRIFPLYYGAVLLFFLLAPAIGSLSEQLHYYKDHKAMSFFHFQNWLYILNEKPNNQMLFGHFWSLSVEEQYYLAWPVIILVFRKPSSVARIAILILLACIGFRLLSWTYNGAGYTNYHFQYMTRMDGLCIGSLLATWRFQEGKHSWKKFSRFCLTCLGFHAAIWLYASLLAPVSFPHFSIMGYTSIAAAFGLLVGYVIDHRPFISRLLQTGMLKFFGKISYGLYIYHWPVLVFCKLYLLDLFIAGGWSPASALAFVAASACLLAIGISIVSYELIERRCLALKDRLTSEDWLARLRHRITVFLHPSYGR